MLKILLSYCIIYANWAFSFQHDKIQVDTVVFAACRKKKAAAELRERKQNYKKSLDNLRDKQTQLEEVRSERARLFTGCFEHISAEIDSIYKVWLLLKNLTV